MNSRFGAPYSYSTSLNPGAPFPKIRGNRFHLVRSADQFEDDLAFGSEVVGDFAVHGHCVILRGV